ncbi:hypothetical protein AOA80_10325 [Methanomassiliicoccales archaeon RumEn M1]|nr:hypothetical protein AOA80_10325 [Methanomassiliicoccales archaeon RumEn M1]
MFASRTQSSVSFADSSFQKEPGRLRAGRGTSFQTAQHGPGRALFGVGGGNAGGGVLHVPGGVVHYNRQTHRPEDLQIVFTVAHGGALLQGNAVLPGDQGQSPALVRPGGYQLKS